MKLTMTHVRFWRAHRPEPKWFGQVKASLVADRPTIDECINAHFYIYREQADPNNSAHNLLNLLRSRRSRGLDLLEYLDQLAVHPGTACYPKRRSGYARKWAKAIRKSRRREIVSDPVDSDRAASDAGRADSDARAEAADGRATVGHFAGQ